MLKYRVIARLDVKGPNVIKGVHMEGLRVVGSPNAMAKSYADQGADEIMFVDCVASLYGRNHLPDVIAETAKDVFIPLTVGGGVRSPDDVKSLLDSGADKISLNTAAIETPTLIAQIAKKYGSQAVSIEIQASKTESGWECLTNFGRDRSGRDVMEWIKEAQDRGAGEIILTSVDRDGTMQGYDLPLITQASEIAQVPIVACGGLGGPQDALLAIHQGADAVCAGCALHYGKTTIPAIKAAMREAGYPVR